jgi:hypothetical protein
MPHEELPFWHFNVPIAQRTPDCPEFLLNITEKDKNLIGMWDSGYQEISWDEASEIIRKKSDYHIRIGYGEKRKPLTP